MNKWFAKTLIVDAAAVTVALDDDERTRLLRERSPEEILSLSKLPRGQVQVNDLTKK